MKTEHAVVIAGGGPTGLMLAGELALARVDVAIVERRATQDLAGSRAGGLHARTIEVLDQRGIADRFLAQGKVAQVASFATIPLDISDFPTRHNYGLALWQNHIERILAGWVDELAVPIYRGREVTGFAQDDTGVDVELSDGSGRYDLGAGHPLLGHRMPDLDLVTADGPRRVFTLLHEARPVLLNFGEPGALDIAPWSDRVQRVDARYAGAWEVPALGAIAAPTVVLCRPDGYVAWVGKGGTDQGLRDALTMWFGTPKAVENRRRVGGPASSRLLEESAFRHTPC